MMIPTPDLSHLSRADYEHVYEPAEDTFILLDALEADAESLRDAKASICLEVGSGSGCVTSFVGKILGPSVLYLCTDINRHACTCTLRTGKQNKIFPDVINANLAGPLRVRLKNATDVIVFNPPYVPTFEDEAVEAQRDHDIGGSWAGGTGGMTVTDRFLDHVEELLSYRGRFYLVALQENNVPEIFHRMLTRHGLHGEIVLQRRAGREHLHVLKFTHGTPTG